MCSISPGLLICSLWDKSIRNLNTSLLKHHWDSHSRSAPNSSSFLSLSSHPSSWLHSVNCWTVLSLFLFIFYRDILALVLCSTAPLRIWKAKGAALGQVHPTVPISTPSKRLAKTSSYTYSLYLVTPGKPASTLISKSDFNCIKILLQPRTTASPSASTILLKSPAQNHPVLPLQIVMVWCEGKEIW